MGDRRGRNGGARRRAPESRVPAGAVESVATIVARLGRLNQSRDIRRLRRWLARQWLTLCLGVLAVLLGIIAWINPGTEAADIHLDEGSVYVHNRSRGLVGQLNYQIDEIAAATTVGDTESTLLQEGSTVLVNNAGSSTLQVYHPATNSLSSPVSPPANALFSLNSGRLAVASPDSGKVWYGPVDQLATSDFSGTASLDLGEFGKAVVSTDGQLIGLDVVNDQIVHGDGSRVDIPFDVAHDAATAKLSAIGQRAVVLDTQLNLIWVEGDRRPTEISSDGYVELAPPMAESTAAGRGGSAIYATRAGLITVDGGTPRSLSGQMNAVPITPVVVGECAYGVFGTTFVKECGGGSPQTTAIPDLPDDSQLAFLTNRSTVVLQDLNSGRVWLVDKGMKIVDDWTRFRTPDESRTEQADQTDDRITLPDRTQPNRPPIARDDPTLGARSGRATILPVLDNDSDDDGDLLTITETSPVTGAVLQITGYGAGLQITLTPEASGTISFTYTISDGRGGTASATATVTVLPPDQRLHNQAPVNIRPSDTLVMAAGTQASRRVLTTWRDPDGDDLVLVNAAPESVDSEDEVSFTTDGVVTFRDVGKVSGVKRIRVWVSDGLAVTEGQLLVDVRASEAPPPIANGDFVSTVVNREVTISPLANDEGNNLTLTEVEASAEGYTVVPNYTEATLTFRASAPGTYYLVYKVSNGPVAAGLIRVDVADAVSQNNPPVAVRDTALVPFGGSVVIDPLINDTDADNDVLVIQSISSDPAVKIVMQERHLVTISLVHRTEVPVPLTYWVSDGRNSTVGTIMVFPAPGASNPVPRAVNDTVTVRAGAAVSVPVLDNDVSPAGLDLRIDSIPVNPLGSDAWVDGGRLRLAIPADTVASTVNLTYQISDTAGRTDSAMLSVTVVSADAQNEPPVPHLVEARVLSRTTTRIRVDLHDIDPNGDAVRLVGLGSGPSLGRITEVGDGWLMYHAYPDSRGTDTFQYQVVDAFGAVGVGEIRVGVAPPSVDNANPVAVVDSVTAAPGRTVNVPVLVNDYDVDGDTFTLRAEDPVEADITVSTKDGFVQVTAPDEPGEYVVKYYIVDQRGGTGSGSVYLTVQADAPPVPPTAVDDQVSVNDALDATSVRVDVLANDHDVDGSVGELTVSVDAASAGVGARVEENRVVVPVTDSMQQLRYTITDRDGLSAQALVLVPGRNDQVPVVADPGKQWEVVAGQPLTINLDTMVKGTRGRHVRLTSADTVHATKGIATVTSSGIDFQADVAYAGPASVVFEVADQADPSDRTARRGYVTILINVLPAADRPQGGSGPDQVANTAPQGPESIQLQVGAGEPQETFPLQGRFVDAEGDTFVFRDWQVTSGSDSISWSASVNGDVLTASAKVTAKGSTLTLSGRVVDAYNASRPVSVTITVVGSTRPLPEAQPDVIADANAGQAKSIPVLANDRSFLLEDQSLELLSAGVVSGNGTARVDGDQVVVTPGEDFVGTLTVRYTIVDATKDADRQVDGMIQLTVRSRPSRPGTPTIEETGDHYVIIKWTSNDPNGMPVTAREVQALAEDGSSVTFSECLTNTCQITGLRNNVTYTFTVTEANEIGVSDASPASTGARPDVKPAQMAAPVLTFPGPGHSGVLVLSWTPPSFDGSPVSTYTITPTTGGGAPVQVDGTATSHALSGLVDNTNYSFTIQATNQAGTSEPSESSGLEHPSGAPVPATNVAGTDVMEQHGGSIAVRWSGMSQTGGSAPDPVTYSVLVDDQVLASGLGVDGAGTGSVIVGDDSWGSGSRRVAIRAESRGGTSNSAARMVTTVAAPRQQATGRLSVTGAGTLTFTLDSASGADWDAAQVEVLVNGQSAGLERRTLTPGSSTVFQVNKVDANYQVQTIALRYASSVQQHKPGASWVSGDVWVYGRPELVNAPTSGFEPRDGNEREVGLGVVETNGVKSWRVEYQIGGVTQTPVDGYDGTPVVVPTKGSSVVVRSRVCDTDPNHFDARGSSPNCSAWREVTVPPVLSATRRTGRTFAVRLDDRRSGVVDFSCQVAGSAQAFTLLSDGAPHDITIDAAVPAGSREISCSHSSLKQSVTVSVP